jgi:hypothetical protein
MLNPSPIPVLVFPECNTCGLEIQETNQRTRPGTGPDFGTSQHWYRLPVTVVSQQLLAICNTIRNDFLVLLLFALTIGVSSYLVCNIELLVIQYVQVNTCKKGATTTNEVIGAVWFSMLVLNK